MKSPLRKVERKASQNNQDDDEWRESLIHAAHSRFQVSYETPLNLYFKYLLRKPTVTFQAWAASSAR